MTGVQFVEVNHVISLRIQVGNLNEDHLIDEKSVTWLPIQTNCLESNLLEMKNGTSIILGDIYVPAQVLIGFHLSKKFDGLVLGVISRPTNKTLTEDINSYEERHKVALGIHREALDVHPWTSFDYSAWMSNVNFTQHAVYQSFIKENRIGRYCEIIYDLLKIPAH